MLSIIFRTSSVTWNEKTLLSLVGVVVKTFPLVDIVQCSTRCSASSSAPFVTWNEKGLLSLVAFGAKTDMVLSHWSILCNACKYAQHHLILECLALSDVVLSHWSILCYSNKLDSLSLSWVQKCKNLPFLTCFWVLVLAPAEASAESLKSILKNANHPLYLLLGLGLGPCCGISWELGVPFEVHPPFLPASGSWSWPLLWHQLRAWSPFWGRTLTLITCFWVLVLALLRHQLRAWIPFLRRGHPPPFTCFWVLVLAPAVASAESLESILKNATQNFCSAITTGRRQVSRRSNVSSNLHNICTYMMKYYCWTNLAHNIPYMMKNYCWTNAAHNSP